jgi:hypothetical protein
LAGPAPCRVSKARNEQHWLAVALVKDEEMCAVGCSRRSAAVISHVNILVLSLTQVLLSVAAEYLSPSA